VRVFSHTLYVYFLHAYSFLLESELEAYRPPVPFFDAREVAPPKLRPGLIYPSLTSRKTSLVKTIDRDTLSCHIISVNFFLISWGGIPTPRPQNWKNLD
jgi:hypothetical protein